MADGPTANLDAALNAALQQGGIRPALRMDLQRPVDPRLQRIEALGLDGCGLFSGRRYEVHNAREIEALSLKLKPGDKLVLAGNDWADTNFTFGGFGTADAPIFVGAEIPGSVVFTGESRASFHGAHLVIMNLSFRDGRIGRENRDVLSLGRKPDHPADHCIVNRILIENVNAPDPATWTKTLVTYLSVAGCGNTVANSTFAHLKHYGAIISTSDSPSHFPQQLHILDNRFVDRPRVDDDLCPYRYKIIQIGWSGIQAAPAGSLIQGNYFEDCASHVELISIKASDVFMRRNRFIRCLGAVNIRMGDRALIQDNEFDGENHPGTGGLRVAGQDHVIIGNTFRRLRPDRSSYMYPPPADPTPYLAWVFSIVAGDKEYSGITPDAYGRAANILIAHNRFEHNSGRLALGSPTPSRANVSLLPRNIRIEHNQFTRDDQGESLFDFFATDASGTLPSEVFLYNNQFVP